MPDVTNESPTSATANDRFLLYRPSGTTPEEKLIVCTPQQVAAHLVLAGLVGPPVLTSLTLTPSFPSIAVDASEGTVIATISGKNSLSTLSVSPAGYFKISTDETQLLKGPAPFRLNGNQWLRITDTLNGSANSPRTTDVQITVSGDVTPDIGDLWSPDKFPELLVQAYFQEDAPEGPVASQPTRGWRTSHLPTQSTPALRPTRLPDMGGVRFTANSGQYLTWGNDQFVLTQNRWALAIFKANGSTGSGTDAPILFCNRQTNLTVGDRSPAIIYSKAAFAPYTPTHSVQCWFVGSVSGSGTLALLQGDAVEDDGVTWNVALSYRRNGKFYSRVNGHTEFVNAGYKMFVSPSPSGGSLGYIGFNGVGTPEFAYDAIFVGQGEPSESFINKLQGWAMWRAGRQADLPGGHPYKTTRPLIDADDFPDRYTFVQSEWDTLTANIADTGSKFVNRGGAAVSETGYITVFKDDFRANTVFRSDIAPAALAKGVWYAPGWNSAVGGDAVLLRPDLSPSLYVHDAGAQTLTLSLKYSSGWKASTIMSVNNSGQGRTWSKGIFEIRCKFPTYSPLPGGLFPAPLWAYSIEPLMYLTAERIETDFYEFSGANGAFCNTGSSHVHSGTFAGLFGHLLTDASSPKIWGGSMVTANIGVDINVFDGNYHVWKFRVDDDLTYCIVDDIELARVPTPTEYKRRLYLVSDFALQIVNGAPDQAVSYDMVIDYISVKQKQTQIESFVAPFTARPTIAGTATVGQTLTVTPHITGATDIDYFWYADGYPINAWDATYVLTSGEVGATIRCMVKAVGAVNQPETWTDATAAVS